jgi:hypothetical protein
MFTPPTAAQRMAKPAFPRLDDGFCAAAAVVPGFGSAHFVSKLIWAEGAVDIYAFEFEGNYGWAWAGLYIIWFVACCERRELKIGCRNSGICTCASCRDDSVLVNIIVDHVSPID